MKKLIVNKVLGTKNPANTLTKHLSTSAEMQESLQGLGVVSVSKDSLENAAKSKLRAVASVQQWRAWKPLTAQTLTLRQHQGIVLRRSGCLAGSYQERGEHRS
jgi:hypothetical protein